MAEKAAIQLAIEKLDSWLAKERCILRDDFEKKLNSRDDGMAELWKHNMKKKAKAYQRCIIEKADLGSLEVGMPGLGEDNKEKLYSFLVLVAGPLKHLKGGALEECVSSLMLDVADLWEYGDEGNIYKKKLHSVLVQMVKSWVNHDKRFYSLIAEMAGVWKDSKGKLSKEKLNSWLANKSDLGDYDKLLRLLEKLTYPVEHLTQMRKHRDIEKSVEKVRDELTQILDIITVTDMEEGSKRLHYFISDALEMAHHAQLFVQVKDSDPFILLLQIFNCRRKEAPKIYYTRNPLELLSGEIAFIRKCILETKKRMLKFGVERQMNVGEELVDPTHSDMVGLDEDVELLLGTKKIICIRGIPGIGKTTLARQLYNHKVMVDQYKARAWVNLSSRELSRKEILIKLLRQLQVFERDDMLLEKMDTAGLREMLSQHLQQSKRVLIVLDHVSSEDTFAKYILDILSEDKENRILFTTRSLTLKYVPSVVYVHKKKYLDDEKSWQLLSKTAFSGISNEEFPKQLKEKVRLILRKCGGLPLAIKEVGRQWAEKRRSGSRWEQIVEESSIDLDLSSTLEALESTYHNLSPELKSCFLYLGLFKEGVTIKGKKMVHVWTAGRVVDAKFEEEYYNYSLNNLSDHSIIEVDRREPEWSMIKTFHINAVFQRLSIKMAEDEIGLDILRKDGNNRSSHEPRHRVIHCSRDKLNLISYSSMNQSQDKHLVSLFFHGGGYFDDSPSYWNNFEQLKILDMEGFGLKILPEMVGELSELRYLGLRNNYIQELPCSLGSLKNLEVLDIVENFMVEVDADIICKMASLCHLYMSDITCRKPLKIDELKNLKTLTYISVDNWAYEVSRLKMMTSLKKLGIEELDGNSNVSKLFASLSELKELKCLILRGFRFKRMPSLDDISLLQNLEELKLEGRLTRLPSANTFPSKLKILSLVNCYLDDDPMPILEKLPELQYLKLQNAYTGEQMMISCRSYLHLVIGELWHLRNLQFKKGAYVYELEIFSCPYLDNIIETTNTNELKIVTTKNIAIKIRANPRLKVYRKVDIQP